MSGKTTQLVFYNVVLGCNTDCDGKNVMGIAEVQDREERENECLLVC